jgi:Domain of unknown function (DUF4349)
VSGAAPQQASGAGATADSAAAVVPAERALVYIADLAVRVDDIDDAVSRTEQVTATAGGTVANAERTGQTTATGTARLVLRVPPDQFWPVIRALEDLGTRVQLTQSSQDMTAEVADVESRVTWPGASSRRFAAGWTKPRRSPTSWRSRPRSPAGKPSWRRSKHASVPSTTRSICRR